MGISRRSTRRLMKSVALLMSMTTISTVTLANDKPTPPRAPLAWGQLGAHKACVIFREYQKTKVRFFVVAATAKTHGELEVIESTDGYVMDQHTYVEDEATMDQLQHRAIRDELRYVKVQDKYKPEELEAARALCKKEVVTE